MKGDEVIKTREESADSLLFFHSWVMSKEIWFNELVILICGHRVEVSVDPTIGLF